MFRILCFGDSNTYGYRPDGLGRFDEKTRWTVRLADRLGESFQIVEEGLCGRTTIFDNDVNPGRRGSDHIGMLVESHNPIDLLIIMLGSNDYKIRYQASLEQVVDGMEQVIEKALSKASKRPEILLISPPALADKVAETDAEYDNRSLKMSREISPALKSLASKNHYLFLDAAQIAVAGPDQVHMTAESHEALANAISALIKK